MRCSTASSDSVGACSLQLAQVGLGARDLRVPHRAAGHEIGLRRRALDFAELCPQLLETLLCLRAAIHGLPVRGARFVAGRRGLIQLAPRRAQLRREAVDLPLHLGERRVHGGSLGPARRLCPLGAQSGRGAGERHVGRKLELQLPGFGVRRAQPEHLELAGDPSLGVVDAGLQAPVVLDHRTDLDAAHVRNLDVQRLDDAQPPAGHVERAAVHAHPPPRLRLELEAHLARHRAQRRPAVVALADRLRQALQSALLVFAGIERGLQALHLARQLDGQPLGRRCGLGHFDLGHARLLAVPFRRRERLARCVAARQLGLNLSQIMAQGRKRSLGLAQLGVAYLELVAPHRQLGELTVRRPRMLVGAQTVVLDAHAVEVVQIPLELVMPGFEIRNLEPERLARLVGLLVPAARPPRLVDQLMQGFIQPGDQRAAIVAAQNLADLAVQHRLQRGARAGRRSRAGQRTGPGQPRSDARRPAPP